MRTKITKIVLAILMLALIWWAIFYDNAVSEVGWEAVEVSPYGQMLMNDCEDVCLTVDSITEEEITFILHDRSEKIIECGSSYDIEVKLDDGWYETPFSKNGKFFSDLVVLEPGQTYSFPGKISTFRHDTANEYRVVKFFHIKGKDTEQVAVLYFDLQ